MRVLYVGTSYPTDEEDWRGVFIRHLAFALSGRDDIDLSMWVPPGPLPPAAKAVASESERHWLRALTERGGIAHAIRSNSPGSILQPLQLLRLLRRLYRREQAIDVYHLNWLQTALPLPASATPVLVTVLGTDFKLLSLPLVKFALRRAMRRRAVAICPNAEWMVESLDKAFGDLAKIQAVPFGIDPLWYTIKRKPDPDRPIWLAVTRLTVDKLGPLLEWSEPLFRDQQRELHLIGPMQDEIALPDWIQYHGPASPDRLATDWFPRATGLVTLSRHAEGRPQVMLEAMAAGIPIIASDLAAHRNIVSHGITGMLCSSPGDYAEALSEAEQTEGNHALGGAARDWVTREIGTWEDCAERYVSLYRQLGAATDA